MQAMVMTQPGKKLELTNLPMPKPQPHELLIKVHTCGICRTDLHVLDGDLKYPNLPLIPGHQIIGTIESFGDLVQGFELGQRVGVPWLGHTCQQCNYCLNGKENLCDMPGFTGYQINGGFAEYCCADHRFCFAIPEFYSDIEAAPLLCAGLIGYRSLSKIKTAKRLGIYGFGAAAHIVIQIAKFQKKLVYAFTKPGDSKAQEFAKKLGASWAGNSDENSPDLLDAAIIFAPIGDLVPQALRNIVKGGIVVCGGIHMTDIPSFSYDLLWGERMICSIANLTRQDGIDFLTIAAKVPIKTEVTTYSLVETNQALDDLRNGAFTGAAVVKII